MSITMYDVSVPVFVQGLKGLKGVLAKALAHAEAKNIDPNVLLQSRLAPDMFPLVRQVQLASDFAKGPVVRLAGAEPPAWEDTETSFPELLARLDKTIELIGGYAPAAIAGSEDREISLVRRGETHKFKGQDYLLGQALPNFWFHVTAAYSILRHNGVEVGKKDFLAMN